MSRASKSQQPIVEEKVLERNELNDLWVVDTNLQFIVMYHLVVKHMG